MKPANQATRWSRKTFYPLVGWSALTVLAENFVAGAPGTRFEELRGFALFVLGVSALTCLIIPLIYLVLLIWARGSRSEVILYVIFGLIFWYLQLAAVSFESAN